MAAIEAIFSEFVDFGMGIPSQGGVSYEFVSLWTKLIFLNLFFNKDFFKKRLTISIGVIKKGDTINSQ